jgi:hypothetical protein
MHVSTASFEYFPEIAELRQLGFADGHRLETSSPSPIRAWRTGLLNALGVSALEVPRESLRLAS